MICTLRKEKITNKLFTALEAIGSGSKTNFDVATRGCPLFIHYSSGAIIPTNA